MTNKPMVTIEDVIERLDRLDILCEMHQIKVNLVLLGGAGMIVAMELNGRSFRPTLDIDVQLLSSNNRNELEKILEELSIDEITGIVDFPPPEDFEEGDKIEIESDFTAITVYVPQIELLACTKIFSKRQKDLADLVNSSVLDLCDLKKLRKMIKEYKSYLSNPDDPNLNLNHLKERLEG